MPLTIYRRHNAKKCRSSDTQKCAPIAGKNWSCPVWVRGYDSHDNYIREPLHTRNWNTATDLLRLREAGESQDSALAILSGSNGASSPGKGKITIEEWRDRFLENSKAENLADETTRQYKLLFQQLIDFSAGKGVKLIGELDLPTLQQFRNDWKVAPITRLKRQERLRTIFRFAVRQKWISENPALDLGKIKVETNQKVPFSQSEMDRILKEAKKAGPNVYIFVLVMRFSGLRISDVCTLKVSSLVGDHLVLRTTKTGTPVKVLLPKVVANSLRTMKTENPEYFFWNGRTKLASVTNLWRWNKLKPVFEKAKVTKAHPHRFRHTFAAELLKNGTSVVHVATLLGNSAKIVEKHYSGWIKDRQDALDVAVKKANGYHSIS